MENIYVHQLGWANVKTVQSSLKSLQDLRRLVPKQIQKHGGNACVTVGTWDVSEYM